MGKRLFPTFVKYVSQSVMGMVGISCYILADTWFVSAAFGAEGLAALNLAIVVYSLMNAAGLMALFALVCRGKGAAHGDFLLHGGARPLFRGDLHGRGTLFQRRHRAAARRG